MQTVPSLINLLACLNHYSHEDIVRLLQQDRDSRAVEALYNAALNPPDYQEEYDSGAALARKCTWALADVGNAEAYHKLLLLAENDNSKIASYAQKRIDLWGKESPGKGCPFDP